MTGHNAPASYACFVFDQDQLDGGETGAGAGAAAQALRHREREDDDELESVGNESMIVHVNNSEVISNDDNNSVTQIDPGNFSESDIDEDVSSNYAPSNGDGGFGGGFPESDIEDEDDDMSDAGSLSLSFASDVGSPMHSSTRSYPVSEDREEEREEATPLPAYTPITPTTLGIGLESRERDHDHTTTTTSAFSSTRDHYDSFVDSEMNGIGIENRGRKRSSPPTPHSLSRRPLRTTTMAKRRSFPKFHSPSSTHQKKRLTPHHHHSSSKLYKRKEKEAHNFGLLDAIPTLPAPTPPTIFSPPLPFIDIGGGGNGGEPEDCEEGSATRSISIPILDLCITEDEGYLGMGEEDTSESDKAPEPTLMG